MLLSVRGLGSAGASLLKNCYALLGVSEGSGGEELREAYLAKATDLHPDTGGATASVGRFLRLREAYKLAVESSQPESAHKDLFCLPSPFEVRLRKGRRGGERDEWVDFGRGSEGGGAGGQAASRAATAKGGAGEYYAAKVAASEARDADPNAAPTHRVDITSGGTAYARTVRSQSSLERLVEDMIVESLRQGDLDDLPGKGKPLEMEREDPYVDTLTVKLNKILLSHGVAPSWITMEKELKAWVKEMRSEFASLATKYGKNLGSGVWEDSENRKDFQSRQLKLFDCLADYNAEVNRFNLLVPILSRQRGPLDREREMQRALREANTAR